MFHQELVDEERVWEMLNSQQASSYRSTVLWCIFVGLATFCSYQDKYVSVNYFLSPQWIQGMHIVKSRISTQLQGHQNSEKVIDIIRYSA